MTKKDISYETARELARIGNDTERAVLAGRTDVQPEILYFLAGDPSLDVRRKLASNRATPRKADKLLASDDEVQVRLDLAEKIARLVPELDQQGQRQVYEATMETLEILVRDQATKVRLFLADALKDVANAPSDIINRLARDAEIVVARPVLTFSPILSTEDLLEIISSNHADGVLGAIAQRRGVAESVSDAIVGTDDIGAIALLLGNESAQIREEALDSVIDRAADIESWHLPLVTRPRLPLRAALRLAHFVAASLVEILQNRGELSEDEISEIHKVVDRRIDDGTIDPDWATGGKSTGPSVVDVDDLWDEKSDKKKKGKPVSPLQIAQDMKENGRLDEAAVTEAMGRGDVDLVIAALSVLSGMALGLVEKAIDSRNPEIVLSVSWKAGLSVRAGEQVQGKIAGIKEDAVLKAKGTKFPIDKTRMKEHLSRLKDAGSLAG